MLDCRPKERRAARRTAGDLDEDTLVARPGTAAVVAILPAARAQERPPLRLAIAGLVHGHVSGFLRGALARTDVQIVGVFEPDAALLRSYGERYKLPEGGAVHRPRRR